MLSVGPVALLQFGQEMVLDVFRPGTALDIITLDLVADLDVSQDDECLLELSKEVIRVERHLRTIHSSRHSLSPLSCLLVRLCLRYGPSCMALYSELV